MYSICKCPSYLEYMFSSNIKVWDWGLMLFSLLLRKLLRLLQRAMLLLKESFKIRLAYCSALGMKTLKLREV